MLTGLIALGLITIVAALATWEAVEIWHHGELFATLRAKAQAGSGFLAQLLSCPFCLSPWLGAVFTLWLITVALMIEWCGNTAPLVLAMPVIALAAARLANVFSDRHKPFDKTPHS